jgi:hypothetical protein
MGTFGGLARYFLVSRIRTDLNFLGPRNLAEFAYVDRAKERFIRKWSKDATTDVC